MFIIFNSIIINSQVWSASELPPKVNSVVTEDEIEKFDEYVTQGENRFKIPEGAYLELSTGVGIGITRRWYQ